MKLSDVTARVLEKYYMQLLKTPSVHRITQKANSKNVIYVAPPTVRTTQHCLRKPFTAGRVQTVLSHRLKPDPKQKQPLQVWILTFWQRYSVIRKWQRCWQAWRRAWTKIRAGSPTHHLHREYCKLGFHSNRECNTLFFIVFPSECFSGRCEIFCSGLRFDCRWIFTRKSAKIGGR